MDRRIGDVVVAFQHGRFDEARQRASELLAASPDLPPVQHLMGLIECRSGRIQEGVGWLNLAAAGEPENAAFRVMLVRALTDAGRAREALEVTFPARMSEAAARELWAARAEAAQAANDWHIAAEAWRTLAASHPSDWQAWSNCGEALARSGRWSEAADALSRALSLNPSETRIRRNFVSALGRAGEYDRSVLELRELILAAPRDAALRLAFARILADLGRTEESMEQLREAARLATGDARRGSEDAGLIEIALNGRRRLSVGEQSDEEINAVRELALLLDRTNRTDALRTLLADAQAAGVAVSQLGYPAAAMALRDGQALEAKRILQSEPAQSDPLRWHRLMAKIEDELGNFEAAFSQTEAMNLAVPGRDEWRALGREYRAELRSLAATLPERVSQYPSLEPSTRPSPSFLVGFPRSGTTLADTFLMGHPSIHVVEEVPMLAAAEASLGGIGRLPNASQEELRHARNAYFRLLDSQQRDDRHRLVIDKLPLSMTRLPLIHALFPDARIIFAQRHPCDSVLSAFMQSFVLNPAMASFLDIGDAGDLYDAAMRLFSLSREHLQLTVHDLVYEELVEEPLATLRPVVEFLGLEWRDELLDHRATVAARGAINTPSYDQVVQPLNKKAIGRWRHYRMQMEPALATLLEWAERLGYGID